MSSFRSKPAQAPPLISGLFLARVGVELVSGLRFWSRVGAKDKGSVGPTYWELFGFD